ncbi:transposable element Tcb1 transposase [Trichonephila clavipes]|nr:transposable element Tcb1 transposase [Trichonephila clavipes]
MCDLSDVKRGMVIGASVSRTANLVGVLRTTVSRVMTAYINLGKVSSAKHNSGRIRPPTTGREFVWRTLTEAFDVDCLVPTVKRGGGSVMVWAAISFCGLGPLVVLRGMISGDHYQSILADHLHPMLQTLFPGEHPVFQDDNAPVHTYKVRARFPPPRTLFELETVLHEEWVQIPMHFVQDLYFSIPRRMQAVIQAKGGPTPY